MAATPGVKKELTLRSNAHGLIKVRRMFVPDDRTARIQALFQSLSEELGAAPIQHIGKLLVLRRPQPEKVRAVTRTARPVHAM